MADNLPDIIENNVLDALVGTAAFVAPTLPMKLRLYTVAGTDSATGTEVTGGSYVSQTVTFVSAAGGTCSNSGAVNYTNMPACTVLAVEIWDSAGSPRRYWYGTIPTPKVFVGGEAFQIPGGQVILSLG